MKNNWLPITYREFYDVPRFFLATYQGKHLLFSCIFDEELDDYPDSYKVYVLPKMTEQELETNWNELHLKADQCLGEVPVEDVHFDPSRRKKIEVAVLDRLLMQSQSKVV